MIKYNNDNECNNHVHCFLICKKCEFFNQEKISGTFGICNNMHSENYMKEIKYNSCCYYICKKYYN